MNFVECPTGCAKCILKSGTTDIAQCLACFPNYYEQQDGKCEGKTDSDLQNVHVQQNVISNELQLKVLSFHSKMLQIVK